MTENTKIENEIIEDESLVCEATEGESIEPEAAISFRYSVEDIQKELDRVRRQKENGGVARKLILALVTVSALSVLVAVLFLPILQIHGNSMTPTLYEGNIVISVKGAEYKQGDVVSVYFNNNVLVKRVIGLPGDWIDIDQEGNVFVNGVQLDEPYITEKAFGNCDLDLPYQVPEDNIFVMGDHRSTSKDSRDSSMGPIPTEKVVGKIVFRIWPLTKLGTIK